MASRLVLFLAAAAVVAAACLPAPASAVGWMVGDDGGWRAKFNQTGWADGKTFRVGDTLTFVYPQENHTVVQVDNKDYLAECDLSPHVWTNWWDSGNDVVTLDRPGKVWFFCSVTGHCDNGMNLIIDVEDGGAPAPAPAPAWWF